MKRCLFFLGFLALTGTGFSQENLFNHVYWHAHGTHQNQLFGMSGLDTLGAVSPDAQHALSIGSDGGSSYILNRFPLDTARQYKFPGEKVIRANFNRDSFPDYLVWSSGSHRITVLYGTPVYNVFDTAFVIQGDRNRGEFSACSIVVDDFDSSGYDGIVVAEPSYEDSSHNSVGRLLYYKGGKDLRPSPTGIVVGTTEATRVASLLAVGHVHDTSHQYLISFRITNIFGTADTIGLSLYPFSPSFTLVPSESLICGTQAGNGPSGGVLIADADGDGIDDILLGAARVLVYRGGSAISSQPTYFFTRPSTLPSSGAFSQILVNLGNISGHGYPSLLVCDPEANAGYGGAVFVYNMGKALKDSCVAVAETPPWSGTWFGTTATGIGDINGDGVNDFAVGADDNDFDAPAHSGQVYVFLGSPLYGPTLDVRDNQLSPTDLHLAQSYPNPASGATSIAFFIGRSQYSGSIVTLSLVDIYGRQVAVFSQGAEEVGSHTVNFDASRLPCGSYLLRLTSTGQAVQRILTIVR